jgi:hypothetical protein
MLGIVKSLLHLMPEVVTLRSIVGIAFLALPGIVSVLFGIRIKAKKRCDAIGEKLCYATRIFGTARQGREELFAAFAVLAGVNRASADQMPFAVELNYPAHSFGRKGQIVQ